MAMNKFMHPRNPYRIPPDFKELAIKYPEFRKFAKTAINGKVKLDFKDEGAVRALTKSLLHKDFQLDVELPPNRLVPTLPLRLNYLFWVSDILNLLNKEKNARGIDIGTGASCIYPLLAAKKFSWNMLATEIDTESIEYARENVKKNKLEECITVKQVDKETILVGALEEGETYDFCMCNPPFFKSESELDMTTKSRTELRPPPKNAQTGSIDELVTEGGEVEFVKKIIQDSLKLKDTVKVYTVMVGQKSSLISLRKLLKEAKVCSSETYELCQGRTLRWGLAWTFLPDLDLKVIQKPMRPVTVKPLSHLYPLKEGMSLDDLRDKIVESFQKISIEVLKCVEDEEVQGIYFKAVKNTWSGDRKRRRLQKKLNEMKEESTGDADTPATPTPAVEETSDRLDQHDSYCEENEDTELLSGSLFLCCSDRDALMEMFYVSGTGGREALNQVFQYIKNYLQRES